MNNLQNLHTHTCYCDGLDTPEEMVIEAIKKGYNSIGFSTHSYTPFSPWFKDHGDFTEEYKKDVLNIKEKYKDLLKIYLGLEVEMYANADMSGYDYLIGSLHYMKKGNDYIGFDRTEKDVEDVINNYFYGSGIEYAKEYYKQLALLPQYGNFDIIAHFDIITKHSDNRQFFDVNSKEYINAAFEAIRALSGKIPFFEVNTGAMARGYRKSPYPSEKIIKEFKRCGFGAVITSDCHDKRFLDFYIKETEEILKHCGYKEKYILTDNGFLSVPL